MKARDDMRIALAEKRALLAPQQADVKRRALSAIADGVEPADVCARFRISKSTLNAWRRESK